MLDISSLGADFKFHAKLVSIGDLVVGKELLGGAMLDVQLSLGLNWLTHKWWSISISWHDSPYGVVDWLYVKADFLISWESGENLRGTLSRMKIQRLVENIWIGDKTDLFAISHTIISLFLINLLNGNNASSAWSNIFSSGGTSISLVAWGNLISGIKHQESIGGFVHKHNIVSIFQWAILAEG